MAVAEKEGIQSDIIPKIATGLCGGYARTSGSCGVHAGAVMAIGMLYGRMTPDDSINTCYTLVNRFDERFKSAFGSVNCTELLGCDLGTTAGQSKFREENLMEAVCLKLVKEGARILSGVLGEASNLPETYIASCKESEDLRRLLEPAQSKQEPQ
ncbi:MAG: C_GCAxxG_C_C family protein [Desulfobacteraceae bacterium]|nr:C_GCAxxG_C_C family protein [Desulfobacteraceae bacterium]